MREGEKSRMMNNNSTDSSSPMKPKSVCIILLSLFTLISRTIGLACTFSTLPLRKGRWNDSTIAKLASAFYRFYIFSIYILKCRYLIYFIFKEKDIYGLR